MIPILEVYVPLLGSGEGADVRLGHIQRQRASDQIAVERKVSLKHLRNGEMSSIEFGHEVRCGKG